MSKEDSPSKESSAADPYATAKANLRDTVKWLAATFSALAAAVIGGTPLSGIGALVDNTKVLAAAAALLLAFGSICAALVITLRLLRSDLLYPSDLDPRKSLANRDDEKEILRLRKTLNERALDLFPPYPTVEKLFEEIETERGKADTLEKLLKRIETERAKAETSSGDPEEPKEYREYEECVEKIRELVGYQSRALAVAAYLRFYNRLSRSVPSLISLGASALLALLVFSLVVYVPKDREQPKPIVVNTCCGSGIPEASKPAPPVLSKLEPVPFATGSARVTDEGLVAVSRARDALRAHPDASLLVRAHTDTVASAKLNASLASRRANAVRQLLSETGGIAAARVFISELPKASLPDLTRQETANQHNRTVEMQMFLPPPR